MSNPVPTGLGRALADLKNAPQPVPHVTKPPSEFTPCVTVEAGKSAVIVTKGAPVDGPEAPDTSDQDKIIRDNGLNPANWVVTSWRRATWQVQPSLEWLESFRCTLAPRGYGDAAVESVMPDLDDLHRAVQRVKRKTTPKPVDTGRVLVVALSDLQVGKVDSRGGTSELLERVEVCLAAFRLQVKKLKPARIILLDGGDLIENFESTGSQDRTNDLSLTEQIRVARRVMWMWIEAAAGLAAEVTFGSVGSNHCRVRRGKNSMGNPSDDFGVEINAQLADMASVNPDKYGHVSFHVPLPHDEGLLLPLPGGKGLGLVHGHQVSSIDKIPSWWSNQSFGRTAIGQADYLVTAHFHHIRLQSVGDGRIWLASATLDSGSSWFRNLSGTESDPGVVTFAVESDGSWGNLAVL